ncbi:hypothetical protein Poly51_56810 [Rubripirellula tenax]|uniref:Uncharacterized protein n=1 Tax=Rubripirellula tenax TaxID=2528015 RepID=A0A5C6ECS3_9BACT|nr:hypothetical protein [Rubripirellula tenax]TWU46285.1 hypothetical protein Poly51_56810 [Rubripirellula tenax]
MGFTIQYCSTEAMHPAQAFEIKQDASILSSGFTWLSCEPVILNQKSDGRLAGASKPNFFADPPPSDDTNAEGLPDGNVLTMTDVLCELSRRHKINWKIGHDYEQDPIGEIRAGVIDPDLLEQLEAFGSIGELLDSMADDDEEEDDLALRASRLSFLADQDNVNKGKVDEDQADDDDEPRLLKFPGRD